MNVSGQKSFVQKNDHLNQTLSVDRPSPPPCSPTSPTYAIRELEKEEVWTYLTNGAMSQFVSALVAGSITAPSLVITATSYWNIKHKQTLNLNWADICHCVVPDIHTTLLPPCGELCFLLFLKNLYQKDWYWKTNLYRNYQYPIWLAITVPQRSISSTGGFYKNKIL